MHEVIAFPAGGYRFLKGDSLVYSLAVAALPGYRLERVRFHAPVPLDDAFQRLAALLAAAGRPPAALAACELRSPAQFDDAGFDALSERYFGLIKASGFTGLTDVNPIARTNVCPAAHDLTDVCVDAFAFTVEDPAAKPSFVLAGALDLRPGDGDPRDLVVAPGQVDAAGIRAKASYALDELEGRMASLGVDWSMTTANNVYCAHDVSQAMTEEFARRGVARRGMTWHLCRPPIFGPEFEMDARCVAVERTL